MNEILKAEMRQTRFCLAFLFCPYAVDYIDINQNEGGKIKKLYTVKYVYWFGIRVARIKQFELHSEARFTIPEFLKILTEMTSKVSYEEKVVDTSAKPPISESPMQPV
jgi:hypothetical protein